MSTLLNKSNHPVQIKKIKISVWTLRDEIEAAIAHKLADGTEASEQDIKEIQNFYQTHVNPIPEETEEDTKSEEKEVKLDADGNPIEEDSNGEESEDKESGQSKEEETQKEVETAPPFKRIKPPEDKIGRGEILLSDVDMEMILLFSNKSFIKGQNVVVEFSITKPFLTTGEVISVTDIGRQSKIIKEDKLLYRIQTKFSHLFPGERSSLREFLTSVEPDIPVIAKKAKTEQEEDDFDDLGF